MVTFNVYKSTSSGAYVEGVCLATDTKPIAGITNGSILYAVDITDGSVKRYMFNQNAATWVEAEDPCAGGGSGLPDVTYLDEGKVMKVAEGGSWELAYPFYRVSISISGDTATIAKAPLDILNFGGYYELYASFAYDQKIYFASLVSSGGTVDGQGHSVYDFQFAGVIKDSEGAKAVVFDFPNQLQSATSMTGTVTFIPLSGSSGGGAYFITPTAEGSTMTITESYNDIKALLDAGTMVYLRMNEEIPDIMTGSEALPLWQVMHDTDGYWAEFFKYAYDQSDNLAISTFVFTAATATSPMSTQPE